MTQRSGRRRRIVVDMRAALALLIILTVALAAAGCGGSDDSGESATVQWADSLCTEIADWTEALATTTDSLKESGLSKEALTGAADELRSATQTFADGLEELGRPDTEAGQQAQDAIDQLGDELQSGVQSIETAVDGVSGVSGVVSAISTVTATLGTMGTELSSTVQELQSLDVDSELQDAFAQADSCDGVIPSS